MDQAFSDYYAVFRLPPAENMTADETQTQRPIAHVRVLFIYPTPKQRERERERERERTREMALNWQAI